ncbi:MAG: hypothetical protein ABW148_18295 [Sedimenticola sp.]
MEIIGVRVKLNNFDLIIGVRVKLNNFDLTPIISRMILYLLNPLVRIEYGTIKSMGEANLSGMKKKLIQNIGRYSEFWREMDIDTLDTLIERINNARTIRELIESVDLR